MLVSTHVRNFDEHDRRTRVPVYVVWELTLACNLGCGHCGSRAGGARPGELSTEECFTLIDGLAQLGTREITLIGGEAFLRRDWLKIVSKINEKGILCNLQTGGFGLTEKVLARAQDSGLSGVGVSIDGLEETHDSIRGKRGSHSAALGVIEAATRLGLSTSTNTQINAFSFQQLPKIYEMLKSRGVKAWQLQLTVAMGNAADNSTMLLQPWQLYYVMPTIAELSRRGRRDGLRVVPGNNIGYFGPFEHLLRGPDVSHSHYKGCEAGIDGLGIEADGTIKGCPSLATKRYSEGNVRVTSIAEIWENDRNFQLNRQSTRIFDGYCGRCYYKDTCRGGCVWTADALTGKPGNNPYCYHRVLELKKDGIREVIEPEGLADRSSFGTGKFAIKQEPWDETPLMQ